MVVIDMNPMPPRVIGKKAYLQTKGISRLSKDPKHKKCPNAWRKKESKGTRDSMKVEDIGVQYNKYDNCCMKQ